MRINLPNFISFSCQENIETKAAETGSHKKGSNDFFVSSEGASFSANSFVELNLSCPLLKACKSLGYQKPTLIQVLNNIIAFLSVFACVDVLLVIAPEKIIVVII